MKKIGIFLGAICISSVFVACFDGKKSQGSDEKFLVVSLDGGIANRLRTLASTHVMAQEAKRTLVIDWPKNEGQLNASFNDLFENDILLLDDALNQGNQALVTFVRANPSYQKRGAYVVPDDGGTSCLRALGAISEIPYLDARHDDEVIHIKTVFNFKPRYMNFDYYLQEYASFYQSLRPVEAVAQAVLEFHQTLPSDRPIIGVHHRSWRFRTDWGVAEPNPVELYVAEMRNALSQTPNAIFFVATDDRDVFEQLKDRFGDDVVFGLSLPEVSRDDVSDIRTALTEWLLLGQTEYIIGTRQSSFSGEAAILTSRMRKIDIGNKIWPFHGIVSFRSDGQVCERDITN